MMNSINKKIFITSFHPLISRNIVSTEIIPMLISKGWEVILLVPDYKKQFFETFYGRPQLIVEGVEIGLSARTKRVGLLKRINEALPNTERAAIGRKLTLSGEKKNKLYYLLFYLPASIIGKFYFLMRLLRKIDYLISPKGRFENLLRKYNPDVIFAADIQNEHDVALLQDARRHNIKSVGMVRSWDNLVTRGLRIIPDKILVHNEIIRDQAVNLYGIDFSKIIITGIPHYDNYSMSLHKSKRDFIREKKINPDKKTILFFPLCDYRVIGRGVQADRGILEVISSLNLNIIVRLSPSETVNLEGMRPAAGSNIYFDKPGFVFNPKITGDRDVAKEDEMNLREELKFCDIVVAGPSTACIDAAIFDKPIVLIGFVPGLKEKGVQIFEYQSEHIMSILKTGGVQVAKNQAELLSYIQEYLKNPNMDEIGRRRIVREQCGKMDGGASRRVVDVFLGL
jgi:hypothetical protein